MLKKINALIAVVMIVTMFLSACSNGGGNNAEGDTIKVGYIGPLTGEGAPWGDAEVNGLKIAVDEINEKGGILGKQVELFTYDNRGDNVETTNAARRLIEQDKVSCIIGTNASGSSISLSMVCAQYKIPHIATTATNPKVTVDEDGNVMPYTFRATLIDPQQGSIAADFAIEKLNAKKAAVMYDISSDYANGLTEFFISKYEENGGTIVSNEAYKAGDVDFRAQLTRIKGSDPDIIFLPATYKEIALIANQSRDLEIDATFVGGDGWISKELFKLATDSVNGSYFVYSFNINSETLEPFKEEYYKRFNKIAGEVSGGCFFTYDCMYVLEQAITNAGSNDSEAIRDALEKVDYKGLTGTIKIDPETHNPSKEGAVFKIVGTEYENAQ